MRVKLIIEYDGTPYCGWQRQKNGLSVQEVLANAITKVTGETVTLHGSGRTDAGVHALGQAVHFDTNTLIPMSKLHLAINTALPTTIRVLSAEQVSDDFNVRFDAKKKTYMYKMYTGDVTSPLKENRAAYIKKVPDLSLMREAAKVIIGEHDFKCFQSAGGHVKTTIRTIYSLTISESSDEYTIEVCGNGFLYNMVRIIVGTLYYVGIGKLSVEDVKKTIETGDRKSAGKTMPACGLYLKSVEY